MESKFAFTLFVAGAVLLLDQASKEIVETRLKDRCIRWTSRLQIRRAIHVNYTYGHSKGRTLLAVLWVAALICAFALHSTGVGLQSQCALIGAAVALAGAAGNLVDVLRRRCVVNFIDLGWWPVFNLADVGIVGGLILAFLS